MSLSIILACYNEIPIIFDTYGKITSMMNLTKIEYEMIIVDDGSSLEFQEQLSNYFREKKDTILILSGANEGRGSAVTKGIKASSKECVGFIDTDLEIPENSIVNLYYNFESSSADIMIGRRIYLLNLNINNWLRYLVSRTYFLIANIVLGLSSLDTESGIKLFKKEKILPILNSVREKRWFWDTEVIAESIRHGLKIAQIPVFVRRNSNKKSSVRVFRDTLRYLGAIYRYYRRQQNVQK